MLHHLIQITSAHMKHKIEIVTPQLKNIEIELDDSNSPNTVKKFVENLPFKVDLNLWGDEIYTEESPIQEKEESAKPLVELNDVAYWPTGKAICLFFGPTPIGKKDEIKPYSPVNVVGKILKPDKSILRKISDGSEATFQLKK